MVLHSDATIGTQNPPPASDAEQLESFAEWVEGPHQRCSSCSFFWPDFEREGMPCDLGEQAWASLAAIHDDIAEWARAFAYIHVQAHNAGDRGVEWARHEQKGS